MYSYNNSLSESDKLVCVGIDIEHQPAFAISYLQTLLPAQTPPEKIRMEIQSIASVSGDNTKAFEIGKILFASIESYTNTYQQYLGEKFFEFRLIVKSLDASRRAYGSRSTGRRNSYSKIRDRTMYENFIEFYKKLETGLYWGHFGNAHILHKDNENVKMFAAYLEQDNSPVANQVLSIFFAYLDCTAMIRSNGGYRTAPSTNVKSYFYDLQQTDEPVLFKLKGEDFPDYSRQLVESIQSGSSTEYFDYLLLIKNATPTEPLGGW